MRRYLLVSLLLLGFTVTAQAMELKGDFTTILAGEPATVESETSKFKFDLEGILNLDLYLSGLGIENTTVLSIGGLQFVKLGLATALGPLLLKDTFIFAPNIIEFDDDLLRTVVFASPDPGFLVVLPFRPFWEDPVSGFDLARLLSQTLGEPLVFRKNIVEGCLGEGLLLCGTFLLADLGSAGAPSLQLGGIFELFGTTVWGVDLSAATYIGARQGGECFGVCKPEERLFRGRVVEGLSLEEEKLTLAGLKLLGGEHAVQVTLDLSDGLPWLSQLELESHFTWRGLCIQHLSRFGGGLAPRRNSSSSPGRGTG